MFFFKSFDNEPCGPSGRLRDLNKIGKLATLCAMTCYKPTSSSVR